MSVVPSLSLWFVRAERVDFIGDFSLSPMAGAMAAARRRPARA